MCVIATADSGVMPTPLDLARMSAANPDGAGIAWHDGQRLHRYRNVDNNKTLGLIIANWDTFKQHPCLIHFRLATHGAVCEANTHPFHYTRDGRSGYIAHNGIAHAHTHGAHASDSRNAIDAWQHHQTSLKDGTQGRFALIDDTGAITWLYGGQTISTPDGPYTVSNTDWLETAGADWDWAYEYGYEAGLEAAREEMLEDDDMLDYTPRQLRGDY